MASLTELLLDAQSPELAKREASLQKLEFAENNNTQDYFRLLSRELAADDKPRHVRQLAGLMLKNGISSSKNAEKDAQLKQRWRTMPEDCRTEVKVKVAEALISPESDVGKAAAQVLAKVGAIEVHQWADLIGLLYSHVSQTQDARRKAVSLITAGYLCEELVLAQEDGQVVEEALASKLLTIVVQGMKDPDGAIKLEAAHALYHALVLARANMEQQKERDAIMEIIVQTCATRGQSKGDLNVQAAGFECLVQVVTEYYDLIGPYVEQIGKLTLETIRTSPEEVAIPAMEFWSTVCDEELYLQDLAENGQVDRRSLGLVRAALPHLIPLLTETLTRQANEEEEDTWNLAMAAGTCLGLVAQASGDHCVDLVMDFVGRNFTNQHWAHREAAVLALGSVMEGPTSAKMQPLVPQVLSPLAQHLQDSSVAVRDTASWTLGRVVQFHPAIVPVPDLVKLIIPKFDDVPRVSANICWVLQVCAEALPVCMGANTPNTTPLSASFQDLCQALLKVVARPDADEKQLRMGAYNALSMLCSRAGNDCVSTLALVAQEMFKHLGQAMQAQDKDCEVQGLICGVLTAVVQRLRGAVQGPTADTIMEAAFTVMQRYKASKNGEPVLQEDALLLVAAVANAVGAGFGKYMPMLMPFFCDGLQNFEETQVCLMATGVIGDLCRALEAGIKDHCTRLLQILYVNLRNPAVDQKIKAAIIPCFGDIALAITGDFVTFLGPVAEMLVEAAKMQSNDSKKTGDDLIDYIAYVNTLREGVLEAYTGIVHGLREAGKLEVFKANVHGVLGLVEMITRDEHTTEAVMKTALGVTGDLVMAFQAELTQLLANADWLAKLVQVAESRNDPAMNQTTRWLRTLMSKYAAPRIG